MLEPDKVRAILEAGEKQLGSEEFEQLRLLLDDLQVFGITPWINAELGKLMSKIDWHLEIEPSPYWSEALQACDAAFLGEELKQMCHAAGVSSGGHKKEVCERLYHAGAPQVVNVMEPHLEKESAHSNPGTVPFDKTRRVKDRLEELCRSEPEEFYRRKKIIREAISERERGKKIKTMPDFTLEELKDILHNLLGETHEGWSY